MWVLMCLDLSQDLESWDTWYSNGTFFKLPLYYQIRNSYYRYDTIPNPKSTVTRYPIYSGGNWSRKHPHGRESWGSIVPRELHSTANVITIPRQFFGEEVKPYSGNALDFGNLSVARMYAAGLSNEIGRAHV